jgi:Ras-related protein Rab-8A
VPTSKGQALADEYGIKFFETVSGVFYLKMWKLSELLCCYANENAQLQSAKTNLNVEEVFFSIARDIKQRLADTDNKAEVF